VVRATGNSAWRRAGLALAVVALVALIVPAGGASGASLSSSRAKSAVIKYVKKRWGSSYTVHPACYKTSSRRSRCFVHMIHDSKSCTKYATVTLRGNRMSVRMSRPSC
jgi:hypothetical protein